MAALERELPGRRFRAAGDVSIWIDGHGQLMWFGAQAVAVWSVNSSAVGWVSSWAASLAG